MSATPYRSTPEFTEDSLPEAIRKNHSTKAGVWGLLVVTEGEITLVFDDPARRVRVAPGSPAVIPPQEVHHVETHGVMRMRVDFYREEPV